uniref:Ig-like domain-containing protein n=1 Tax=Esox lucius TaxID=8010 RepID=A0AAY5KS32_ESOLU
MILVIVLVFGKQHLASNFSDVIGQSVTLNCTYDSEDPLLYWYRHYPNQAPQFILYKGAKSNSDFEKIPDKRYKSKTSDTSTELVIQQLTLSDTGFYYCAVDTVIQSV